MPKTATDKAKNDATNNTGSNQPNNNPNVFFDHISVTFLPHHPLSGTFLQSFLSDLLTFVAYVNDRWFRCSELHTQTV